MSGNVMGVIPKNFLVVLLKHHHWYIAPEGKDVTAMYKTHDVEQKRKSVNLNGSLGGSQRSLSVEKEKEKKIVPKLAQVKME